jgi:hypothetical protein
MKLQEILPVTISITVIILVAAIQKQSKLVAAVTATMPVTIPLTLWIVYSSTSGDTLAVEEFTRSMLSGIIPTVAFVLAIYLGSRAGLKLLSLIVLGYSAWGLTLLGILLIRRLMHL